jgi:hypothetical protein
MYVLISAEIYIELNIMMGCLVAMDLSVIGLQLLTLLLLLFDDSCYCIVVIDSCSLVNAPCSCF